MWPLVQVWPLVLRGVKPGVAGRNLPGSAGEAMWLPLTGVLGDPLSWADPPCQPWEEP